jgi:Ni/Co efflux regulator RcnB
MKSFKYIVMAAVTAAMPMIAQAQSAPGATMVQQGVKNMGGTRMPKAGGPRNWGPRHNGRWAHGYRAPGGWGAYRRPFVGFALPSYWVNPAFFLSNYWSYGFSRPSVGYGWSRYYNDAVLTDRYGRVQDYVPNVQWDRYDRYDDAGYTEDYSDSYGYRDDGGRYDDRRYDDRRPQGRDRDGGLGGAVVGGAVGAIAGSAIAGRGDRTAGALLGAGLGAVAGAAVDVNDSDGRGYKPKKTKRIKHSKRARDLDYDYGYDAPTGTTHNGQWQGQWTGRWNDGPTQTWEGTYEGTSPHWQGGARPYPNHGPQPVVLQPGGQYIYRQPSYGYGGETITVTVQSQPVVTTHTTVTEEVVYAAAPRKRYVAPRKKVYKPRPKPRCVCK